MHVHEDTKAHVRAHLYKHIVSLPLQMPCLAKIICQYDFMDYHFYWMEMVNGHVVVALQRKQNKKKMMKTKTVFETTQFEIGISYVSFNWMEGIDGN